MEAVTEASNSAKILDVLCKINERIEHLDQRLQAVQNLHQGQHPQQSLRDTPVQAEQWLPDSCHRSFTTKQRITPEGQTEVTEINIIGGELLSVLKRLSSPCSHAEEDPMAEKHVFPFTQLIALCSTISCLQKHGSQDARVWREVLSLEEISEETLEDIHELAASIRTSSNSREYYTERSRATETGFVRFAHLLTLFAPGMLLVDGEELGKKQFVKITSCEAISTQPSSTCYHIEYWHLRWGGSGFTRVGGNFEVQRYTGARHIDQLPFRPALESLSTDSLQAAVRAGEERLRMFRTFSQTESGDFPMCLCMGGLPVDKDDTETSCMIIDPEAYVKHFQGEPNSSHTFGSHCPECSVPMNESDTVMSARNLLLVPIDVEGFHINSGRWLNAPLINLRPMIISDREGLNSLKLDQTTKESLKTGVMSYLENRRLHNRNGTGDVDFIPGKLRGLVYHFHGPQGSGKTLLAEVLAEYFRRPILSIRLDFVTTAMELEEVLSKWMRLSTRWGAILSIRDADELLEPKHLHDGGRVHSLLSGLTNSLNSFYGILVLMTNRNPTVDYTVEAYIKERIAMPQLNRDDLLQIFHVTLQRHLCVMPFEIEESHKNEILAWFKDAIEDWHPSGREVRNLVATATSQASVKRRVLTLNDLITAYTAKTGKRNDWDFVADETLVYEEAENGGRLQTALKELTALGNRSVPDDGRLPFMFLADGSMSEELWSQVGGAIRLLKMAPDLRIVDWGWPRGRWRRQDGCIYRLGKTTTGSFLETGSASEQWMQADFTFGLRRLLQNYGPDAGTGKPWRRLVLCQGLMEVPLDDSVAETLAFGYSINQEHHHHLYEAIKTHIMVSPQRYRSVDALGSYVKDCPPFHVVFYELVDHDDSFRLTTPRSTRTVAFYDSTLKLKKCSFTMLHIPYSGSIEAKDPIHWTVVCLTPSAFWPSEEAYRFSESPSLRAQSLHYVAKALWAIAARWRGVLDELENLTNRTDALRQPDRLHEILFDDDSFSTSKRYFWIINLVHDIDSLLGDNIEKWTLYEKTAVAPFLQIKPLEDWQEKAMDALEKYRKEASEACEELKQLRQSFQVKLERVTVMRDGLFNASAVMETRASTQLGENIRLLTFVNIFFLPLGLGTSLWSINESYSRKTLAITAVLLTFVTFLVTFNLNNLARAVNYVYSPRRRGLVGRMENDYQDRWTELGRRFKAFDRPRTGEGRPSEWMIIVFSVRQIFLALIRTVRNLLRRSGIRR
ncbi:hypothetical protein HD806DRAFT_517165 [Xylariaceae sp. AK1471]|nr:hypothetical protein HD806DRAFT_517165 [Xylariaceae sp. AK1471]